jgi:serine-type D-Ala-D-Ala carboxypeptidase/endopeptidase
MKKIIALLLLLNLINYCSAQRSDNPLRSALDSAIDRLVLTYMKEGNRVGLSLGVSVKGRTYFYNYGETSPGSGQLPTARSVYQIGSITKTFTGLLIAQAVTEGKLNLNDDIRTYLPGHFPDLQYSNGDPVKVAYLLAHTAQFPASFGDMATEQAFLDSLRTIRLDSLRGFRYRYSNIGYQLLAVIAERIYQQPYAALVRRFITTPMGMTQTKLTYAATERTLLLKGHDVNRQAVDDTALTVPGAGGLSSSVSDLLRYLQFQSAEKTAAVRLTHRILVGDVDKEAYGFQWAIGKTWGWDQYMRIDGGINGFRSYCVMYPLREVSIVLLSNQKDDTAGFGLYKIATGIYAALKKQM